jgi:hypothetical protein
MSQPIRITTKDISYKYANQNKTWVSFILDDKDVANIASLKEGECALIEIDA